MCIIQSNLAKMLFAWLMANLMLPMFLPAIILYAYSLSQGGGDNLGEVFIKLMKCGTYVFSSFSLTFSLFEDYEPAKRVVHPIHYLLIVITLIFLIFFFLISNPVFDFYNSVSFKDIALPYTLIFIALVVLNTILKYRVLSERRFLR